MPHGHKSLIITTIDEVMTEYKNQNIMSSHINRMAVKLDLPVENHLRMDEEETFMRMWDMQTFGQRPRHTPEQVCNMWRHKEESQNKAAQEQQQQQQAFGHGHRIKTA